MTDYIIQKAVEPGAVLKKHQRPLWELAQTYEGQAKYDGCCSVIRPDMGICMSRTGERYISMNPVAEALRERGANGLVLIGEAWHPTMGFNNISGEFRRHAPSDKLFFVANDALTVAEFNDGRTDVPYAARRNRLCGLYGGSVLKTETFDPGTYDPQVACNNLVDRGGYDGFIMRNLNGGWTVGSGKTGEILKIKRKLSFDLQVIGWEPGKGKHAGKLGAIIVSFRGKELRVGTGFSDHERENYETLLKGQIAEIEAMDYSSDGLLREPRFKGIRHDKLEPDS